MPIGPIVTTGGVAAAVVPFIELFRPTKSPYLIVVLVGIGGLIGANFVYVEGILGVNVVWGNSWFLVSVPLIIVLCILTLFSFLHKMQSDDEENKEENIVSQLKFARSICISSAMLCLVVGTSIYSLEESVGNTNFWLLYIACIFQTAVSVIYTATSLRTKEPGTSLNQFQISLITAAYLIAITICFVYITKNEMQFSLGDFGFYDKTVANGKTISTQIGYFNISMALFYLLWLWCQAYWVLRLTKIIKISVIH